MHGRPTAQELVDAVQEFLDREVLPAAEGALRFQTLVASNVLRTVGRELRLGAAQAVEYDRTLDRLGFPDEAALCAAIRSGELDDRVPELVEELTEVARNRLLVANPGYLDQP